MNVKITKEAGLMDLRRFSPGKLEASGFAQVCLIAVILLAICLAACAEPPAQMNPAQAAGQSAATAESVSAQSTQLQELRIERTEDKFSDRLAIGPGDVIEITVAGVPELKKYKVRVSADNTIAVPLIGVVQVGGLTEEQLRQALYERLEKPVKNPQVEVFVVQYHSREVAVVGMVHKPGLYSITSRSDTILDMIDRAGGMSERASSRILFIPASTSTNPRQLALTKNLATMAEQSPDKVGSIAATSARTTHIMAEQPDRVASEPARDDSQAEPIPSTRLLSMLGEPDPIEIDMSNASHEAALELPVRPGDTIIIPAAGEVMVDGWVANPGAFRIVPGMTALSSVSAAGGALFSETAEVLRTNPNGSRSATVVDLSKIKSGQEADVPVQAGDVVFVCRSTLGALPYAFYELFTKFGTGMYAPVP